MAWKFLDSIFKSTIKRSFSFGIFAAVISASQNLWADQIPQSIDKETSLFRVISGTTLAGRSPDKRSTENSRQKMVFKEQEIFLEDLERAVKINTDYQMGKMNKNARYLKSERRNKGTTSYRQAQKKPHRTIARRRTDFSQGFSAHRTDFTQGGLSVQGGNFLRRVSVPGAKISRGRLFKRTDFSKGFSIPRTGFVKRASIARKSFNSRISSTNKRTDFTNKIINF